MSTQPKIEGFFKPKTQPTDLSVSKSEKEYVSLGTTSLEIVSNQETHTSDKSLLEQQLVQLCESFPKKQFRMHKDKKYVELQCGNQGEWRRACKHGKRESECPPCDSVSEVTRKSFLFRCIASSQRRH